MNAKLIVEGKEFDIEILDTELQELVSKSKNKTGYERVGNGERFFFDTHFGPCLEGADTGKRVDETMYDIGNYYSDKTIAENNIRADKLMRQLRRFAVEHRKNEFDWNNEEQEKWSIFYDANVKRLQAWDSYTSREFNSIYFDSIETVDLVINMFGDELLWYFTEYKDSL